MSTRRSVLGGLAAAPLAGAAGLTGAATATSAKPKDGLATAEQMAAMPFEALIHEPGDWAPPTVEEWTAQADPILTTTNLAWHTLHKTKDELVNMVDQMWSTEEGVDLFKSLIAELQRAQGYFEGYTKILRTAEVRLMCALAAGEGGTEGEDA